MFSKDESLSFLLILIQLIYYTRKRAECISLVLNVAKQLYPYYIQYIFSMWKQYVLLVCLSWMNDLYFIHDCPQAIKNQEKSLYYN